MDLLELFVKIGVDDSGLDSGLSNAESKASGFGSKVGKVFGTVAKVGVAAMAAIGTSTVAAGTALDNGAKGVAEYGDNIDKMSQKMGAVIGCPIDGALFNKPETKPSFEEKKKPIASMLRIA